MIFEGTKKSIFFGLGLTRTGQVYPEITNFIQISNLFNATIDYLVLELKDGFVLYHGSYCEVKEPDLKRY